MSDNSQQDKMFGDIAIEQQLLTKEKLDRALLIQRCITNRTKVYLPIGAVLQKMGLLSEEQVETVLAKQNNNIPDSIEVAPVDEPVAAPEISASSQPLATDPETNGSAKLSIVVSPDKLTATIAPVEEGQPAPSLDAVKLLLMEQDIDFGVISDKLLATYLERNPMPPDPFIVARGTPPVEGVPPEIIYHFDIDPLRIGTLLEDGTMDWKNRGEIPQVAKGDLLAEKVGGEEGKPGTSVHGQEIKPPRVKEPALKFTKGAERSEDKTKIFAKINGTPKLGVDGRIGVFGILPIDTDVGIETGNVNFDGHIEVDGGVCSGYTVKGGSLNTREIQSATIELAEDLVSYGGIYSSTITVGGHLKASHIHNSTVEVLGDLVVEKELFGCTVLVNGRCLIESGKIIGSKITAKKGIQTKDIGTRAAKPSELVVGVDFKNERDIKSSKERIDSLEKQIGEANNDLTRMKETIDKLDAELGSVAQEQDGCMVQKRELEEKLKNPAISQNKEKSALLNELITDLGKKYNQLDKRVHEIMSMDDQARNQLKARKQFIEDATAEIEALEENIIVLEEAAKVDAGIPVVKASGMVYTKTSVAGPHKKIIIPKDMQCVRIAESLEDGKMYQIKISNLR